MLGGPCANIIIINVVYTLPRYGHACQLMTFLIKMDTYVRTYIMCVCICMYVHHEKKSPIRASRANTLRNNCRLTLGSSVIRKMIANAIISVSHSNPCVTLFIVRA